MEPHASKAGPLSPQTNHISVLAGRGTPISRSPSVASPPTHYTGSSNYTDTEWREVQAWGHVKETHEIHKVVDHKGRKLINTYEIIKEIGRGVHGKVKLARTMDTNEMVALKIIPRKKKARLGRPETNAHEQTVKREIAILKKCVHPHVVRLREVIDDPASEKIYLVLEYMWGGEVIWRTDDDEPALKLHQARSTFRDTMLGLEFLHYQGIIHRDIKPANLLWTKNHSVKISDFGVSHTTTATDDIPTTALELAKTAGTPAFFAPELCWTTEVEERPAITKAIDIWALGVTLFCLLCGRVPFEAHNEFELFEKIISDKVEIPSTVDMEARDLLKRMLNKDPLERITIPEIKRHPFVLKGVKDPEQWISDTNPGLFGQLEVNDQEVYEAVSSYESFKRRLTKIGSRLAGGLRRRPTNSTSNLHDAQQPRSVSRRIPSISESSSKSSSWMNFMRTSDSGDGVVQKVPFYRITSEEHIHPGARPIMRHASPRHAVGIVNSNGVIGGDGGGGGGSTSGDTVSASDNGIVRSSSPKFKKQPIKLHASRDGLSVASDAPQSHLTRSMGFRDGLVADQEDANGPKLPSLDFESLSMSDEDVPLNDVVDDEDDEDDEPGLLIDFDKRRLSRQAQTQAQAT